VTCEKRGVGERAWGKWDGKGLPLLREGGGKKRDTTKEKEIVEGGNGCCMKCGK